MTGIWAPRYSVEVALDEYKQKVGKELSIYFLPYQLKTQIPLGIFDKALNNIKECAKFDVIPFITYGARMGDHAPKNITKDIYSGEYDKEIIQAAKDLKKIGDEYGGFFIRTLREMNLSGNPSGWPQWGGNPKKFKKAWNHIWNIFENEGTNEYATWVFNPYVGPGPLGDVTSYIKKYMPDSDKFDWIGGNAFNFGNQSWGTYYSFKSLFRSFAKFTLKHCPDKPVMACNTGTDEGSSKPQWTSDMFETLESKYRHFKAIAIWSEHWSHGSVKNFDSKIDSSPEALEAYKQGISDPYFIGKISYEDH